MSKYVETVMTASETVLDGSWKEDNTYPVSEEMIKNREMHIVDIMKKYKWTHEKAATMIPCDRARGELPLAAALREKEPVKQIIHNYGVPPHLQQVHGPLALSATLMSNFPVNDPPRPLEPVAAATYEDAERYLQTILTKAPSWIVEPRTVFYCHLHRHHLEIGCDEPPSSATCNGCSLGSDNF
jgi:hypothetical protein